MKLNNNDLIRKETASSMTNHWVLAISCLLLCLSGFAFLFHIQSVGDLFGGFPMMRNIHNWLGVVFAVSLVLSMWNWLEECTSFGYNDILWCIAAGGYLGKFWKKKAPPMHKLNTGQKLFYLCLLIFGFGIILSGFFIWLSPGFRTMMILAHFLHNVCFILIGIFLPIHIYLSTLGNPGTIRIMIYGTVPVWWARKKSQQWVEEIEEGHSH
ncbi:MAG: cytochrome b/b6 domain-containing protein [Geobacteraceae bacterium]|jgi:formate dehydrogenase subunit gamma